MSKIAVNEITDEVGTGAPAFPNGMSVTGAALTDPEITGGVYLGGTGSANYLDDYEEGTFTPVLNGSSGSPSVVYNLQYGYYRKVGNLVTVTIYLETSSVSGGSGNIRITGLPFTNGNFSNNNGQVSFITNNVTHPASTTSVGAYVPPNSTFINTLNTVSGAGWTQVPIGNVPNSSAFTIGATYLT